MEELTETDYRNESFPEETPETQVTDREKMKAFSEELSMLVRGIRGLPVEPEEWYSKLIDVKNKDERSRFPTYPLLARQVALRLLHKRYGDKARACDTWANLNASGLIGYKGMGRKEWVEASKAPTLSGESPQVYVGSQQRQIEQQKKRHWWQGKPKTEESEFTNQ